MAQWKNTLQRIEIGGYDFCSFTQAQKDFAMCLIKMAYNDGLEEGAADIKSRIFYALEVQPEIDAANDLQKQQHEKLP